MQIDTIIGVVLNAAELLKKGAPDVARQAIQDSYNAAKSYLEKKFNAHADAARALEMATAKPESLSRRALLIEESASLKLESDQELAELIEKLGSFPQLTRPVSQNVQVTGHGNAVQVVGRDLIHTSNLIRKNAITPDERHLSADEREHVRELIREVAERLDCRSNTINFGAVHRMLQRRFGVASFLLIPREKYGDVISFLRERRAMFRDRLRRRNPVAWKSDLYRAIFAGAREIGWSGQAIYQFAGEKLRLKTAIASLKELSPGQLKTVADSVQNQTRKFRTRKATPNRP